MLLLPLRSAQIRKRCCRLHFLWGNGKAHTAKEYVVWEVLLFLSLENIICLRVPLAVAMRIDWVVGGRMGVAGAKDRLSKRLI